MKFDLKKLNKIYVDRKELHLKKLDDRKTELLNLIDKKTQELELKQVEFSNVKTNNNTLRLKYENYKNNFISSGIIFEVEYTLGGIKEWDNLYLKKKSSRYLILSKNGDVIFEFDVNISQLLEDISNDGFQISIVVIRVKNRTLRLQVRFNKNKAHND